MHLSCGVQRIQQFKTRCVKCESDTNRASVPMMLLSRVLRNYGIRFVLSGEGADELFAGYSYNFYFPGCIASHNSSLRLLSALLSSSHPFLFDSSLAFAAALPSGEAAYSAAFFAFSSAPFNFLNFFEVKHFPTSCI